MEKREGCGCCNSTGKIKETEFVDGDESACMTCNGSGSFTFKIATLNCFVKVVKDGNETDLGGFKMLEQTGEGLPSGVFLFDYYALTEELINRCLLDDEDAALLVCQHIESSLNEGHVWQGSYSPVSEHIFVNYSIEPDAVKTEDGYVFLRQPDGSYSDGDMFWESWKTFQNQCDADGIKYAPGVAR